MRVLFPNLRRAAERASASRIPRATFSSISICRYDSISARRSRSHLPRSRKRRQLIASLRDGLQNPADRPNHLLPTRRLRDQLLSARRRQPVIPCPAIVLRCPPEGRDPAAILQPMKGRIKRPMLNLEDILGTALDSVRDGVTVGRA